LTSNFSQAPFGHAINGEICLGLGEIHYAQELTSPDTNGHQQRPGIFNRLQKEPLEIGRGVPFWLRPFRLPDHKGVAALPGTVTLFAEQAAPVGNETDSVIAVGV
jgi:hypothetical protein